MDGFEQNDESNAKVGYCRWNMNPPASWPSLMK